MKNAQMQLSFGMIFSIFLIAVFMFVAFFAIKIFLDIGAQVNAGSFISKLKSEVDDVWRGGYGDTTVRLGLKGGKLSHICFFDVLEDVKGSDRLIGDEIIEEGTFDDEHNLYFYPEKFSSPNSVKIDHVDMEGFDRNPYCIERINDKIEINLKKEIGDEGDGAVTVS